MKLIKVYSLVFVALIYGSLAEMMLLKPRVNITRINNHVSINGNLTTDSHHHNLTVNNTHVNHNATQNNHTLKNTTHSPKVNIINNPSNNSVLTPEIKPKNKLKSLYKLENNQIKINLNRLDKEEFDVIKSLLDVIQRYKNANVSPQNQTNIIVKNLKPILEYSLNKGDEIEDLNEKEEDLELFKPVVAKTTPKLSESKIVVIKSYPIKNKNTFNTPKYVQKIENKKLQSVKQNNYPYNTNSNNQSVPNIKVNNLPSIIQLTQNNESEDPNEEDPLEEDSNVVFDKIIPPKVRIINKPGYFSPKIKDNIENKIKEQEQEQEQEEEDSPMTQEGENEEENVSQREAMPIPIPAIPIFVREMPQKSNFKMTKQIGPVTYNNNNNNNNNKNNYNEMFNLATKQRAQYNSLHSNQNNFYNHDKFNFNAIPITTAPLPLSMNPNDINGDFFAMNFLQRSQRKKSVMDSVMEYYYNAPY